MLTVKKYWRWREHTHNNGVGVSSECAAVWGELFTHGVGEARELLAQELGYKVPACVVGGDDHIVGKGVIHGRWMGLHLVRPHLAVSVVLVVVNV